MEKIELHGATLPEGWTASHHSHRAEILLIERPQDAAGFGGYVTVDLKNRIFRDGINGLRISKIRYAGRGWAKLLINDAREWLEKTIAKKNTMTKAKTPATQAQKDAALASAQRLLAAKTVNITASAGAWPKAETQIHNSTTTTPYDGRELRPFAGRPGSLNFLACPSLRGGRRVFRGGVL